MSAPRPQFRFDPEWRTTLFTVLLVPCMIGLGFWQLQRAEEKASLAATFAAHQLAAPAQLSALWDNPAQELAFTPVQLKGHFLSDEYFLLDNQVRNGQVGYEVLGVLQLPEHAGSVIVNRGWVAGGASRDTLPLVSKIDSPAEITGHVYVAPGQPYLLAEQQLDEAWPKRIQAVEMEKLIPAVAAISGDRVFPYPVRINAGEPGALVTEWQIANASPQKHQAYAVQWFSMAAVLFVFYLLRSSNLQHVVMGSGRQDK